MLGIYTFTADNSPPEYRTLRLATMNFFRGLASPIATQLGAWLYAQGGYVCVYGTALLIMTLGVLMGFARLWNFEEKITIRRRERRERGEEQVCAFVKTKLYVKFIIL